MDWFIEDINGYGIAFKVEEKLYEAKGIQSIEIYQTQFGRMLVVDGCIQVVEEFEKTYHEMLVHVPMFTHPNPKNVLIIGGGDGGAAREVLKHNPESVTVVEIDKNVVDACIKYMNVHDNAFNDKRVNLRIEDGINFVKECEEKGVKFDVLIVDGTDPSPASKPLFSKEFFKSCSEISDIFCMQSQSPLLQKDYIDLILKNSDCFKNRKLYISCIPMYPGCMWSFMIASNIFDIIPDLKELEKRYTNLKINTYYYNPLTHLASFALPNWMKNELKNLIFIH